MNLRRKVISLLLCLASFVSVARPVHKKVELTQPDGTKIVAILSGDEYLNTLTDLSGNILVKDKDGYYRPGVLDPVKVALAEERRAQTESIRREVREEARTKAGTLKRSACVVILAEFKDIPFTYSREQIEKVFTERGYSYGGATGSVADYFEDQLAGNYEFDFVVGPKVTLPENRAYYGSSGGSSHLVVRDACNLAHEAGFDFSPYDYDNNREVDNVFVIFSGKDQADSGEADAIWAYQWYLFTGGRVSLVLDNKRINCFTLCSEMSPRGNRYDVTAIGTLVHEFSHTIGLWDMYDTDGANSGGYSPGIYGTGVMDVGCYLNNSNTPAGYSALDYDCLGIGECSTLEIGKQSLEPVSTNRRYLKIQGSVNKDYFLFECRTDKKWDKYVKGKGLGVYHIDKSNQRFNGVSPQTLWTMNSINNYPDHMCAKMMAPLKSCSGSSQAFFPYSGIDTFSMASEMPFTYWNGEDSPIALKDIKINEDGSVSFEAFNSDSLINQETEKVTIDAYQTVAIVSVQIANAKFSGNVAITLGDQETVLTNTGNGLYSILLQDLTPGTEYDYKLQFVVGNTRSNPVDLKVVTRPLNPKGEPYIGISKVSKGLPLTIMDAVDVVDVRWYYNGKSIYPKSTGYYIPKESGILRAVISYKNGDTETITKEISL